MDILSCLPDEVICHILCFLPTKRSVQTSVLSKRWRFLWTHVPVLEFSFDDTNTVSIITKIVLQHNHDIHTFRLSIGDLHGIDEEFESWILNITTRNIRNLYIGLDNFQLNLPRCLFVCNTLVDLWLDCCGNIPTSGIYFPALKKLKLSSVGYESHQSLAHLISGCPVLEELIIEETVLGQCIVSSPTITRLDLQIHCYDGFLNFGLKLDTPKLMYLWIDCCMPLSYKFSVGTLDSLCEAHIDLSWDEQHQENFDYSRCVLALVSKLYNVKQLTLVTHEIGVIHDSAFSTLAIKFHNLTKLSLFSSLAVFKCFLENADNLQVLHLEIHSGVDIEPQYWVDPKQVPRCLVSRLLTVNVSVFGCFEHEFDALGYILMNAKVLKNMEILTRDCELDWEKKFQILKRVASFKRGSQECELVFD